MNPADSDSDADPSAHSQGKRPQTEGRDEEFSQNDEEDPESPNEGEEDGADDYQENLLADQDEDMASSDSELQVKDPSQDIREEENVAQEDDDPMKQYYEQEHAILQWLANNPGQKWIDKDFPLTSSQFYEDPADLPDWGSVLKNLEWRRPEEIIKDPKFMIIDEDKGTRNIDIQAKHGLFAASWFVGAVTIAGTRAQLLQKLVIEKEYFDKGFVSFQFFKNGSWVQVIVDTLLPYQKQLNNRVCLYSSCSNPQEFWLQLMEKAYCKLHSNYERICGGNILEGLVDLTGGVSELVEIQSKDVKKDAAQLWNILYPYYQQKFMLGSIKVEEERGLKNAQQGQQGILENHYYTIIDMRDFTKENLKLVRLRNPWGNEGVWTGPFYQEADDWEKYKTVKEELKNVPKTKKSDGSWWMAFPDFILQFSSVVVNKVFPESWEVYSISSQWAGKSNGGRCPLGGDKMLLEKNLTTIGANTFGDKTGQGEKNIGQKTLEEAREIFKTGEHTQPESDDRWFNNPQFRIKVLKDTRIYISLMQEDEKITRQPYASVGFMIAATKSRTERFWERPPETDIIAEVNSNGLLANQREITHYLTLKKFEKSPGMYIIVPNINEGKEAPKKDEIRKFYLRLFTPEAVDVNELPESLELSVEGQWTESSAGGSRKIYIKEDGNGKKKGEVKDNPNWCKNPQYFVSIKQPTIVKIILRKAGLKKYKGWKVGMTVCRYEIAEEKRVEKEAKREKNNAGRNLKRLIQQTSQFLQPPVIKDVERKLSILPHQKFKESIYLSEDCSALLFKWNPTEGPFIIIPSSDGQERVFPYKLTIFSNNPVEMIKLDQSRNQSVVGRWEKDISAGGCHLNEKDREVSHRTWAMNPKYHLVFKEDEASWDEPVSLKITLSIAERNWKKLNPNTVSGMIGIYLLEKREGKLSYSQEMVVSQTSFMPVKSITLQVMLGGPKSLSKTGYLIVPSTFESKVQGAFILSVKCENAFELLQSK